MPGTQFPSASMTASAVAAALARHHTDAADRLVAEIVSRVMDAPGALPAGALDKPPTTGDVRYDTLLAVALAYALERRGQEPLPWMLAVAPLSQEWLWDGDADASPAFREYIRRQTPQIFLQKLILLRERDLRTM